MDKTGLLLEWRAISQDLWEKIQEDPRLLLFLKEVVALEATGRDMLFVGHSVQDAAGCDRIESETRAHSD